MIISLGIMFLFLFVSIPAKAQFGDPWVNATMTSSRPLQGAFGFNQCFYETGPYTVRYEFSINYNGPCPFFVQINIQTGQVREKRFW